MGWSFHGKRFFNTHGEDIGNLIFGAIHVKENYLRISLQQEVFLYFWVNGVWMAPLSSEPGFVGWMDYHDEKQVKRFTHENQRS